MQNAECKLKNAKCKIYSTEFWADIGTVFTTPEGETGIYVSGRDVTEQRRAEEELRAKELQLVHSGRLSSLGEMATGIAHEMGGASFKVALSVKNHKITQD